jgi:hypothetical protein
MVKNFEQIKQRTAKVVLAVLMLTGLQLIQGQSASAALVPGDLFGIIQTSTGNSFGETVTGTATLTVNDTTVATFYSGFGIADSLTVVVDTSTLTSAIDSVTVTIDTTTSTVISRGMIDTATSVGSLMASTSIAGHRKFVINFSNLFPVDTYTVSVRYYSNGVASGTGITKFTYIRTAQDITEANQSNFSSIPLDDSTGFTASGYFRNNNTETAQLITMTIPAGALGGTGRSLKITNGGSQNYKSVGLEITGGFTGFVDGFPAQITMPKSLIDTATLASGTAGSWTSIPLVTSKDSVTATTGTKDGYVVNGALITIYSYHLTEFGYRVNQAPVTLTAPASLTVGGSSGTLSASGGSGTVAYIYASSTTGVCTVSSSSVTPVAAGTCSLTASNPASGDYMDTTSATVNVTVSAAAAGGGGGGGGSSAPSTPQLKTQSAISLTSSISTIEFGGTFKITVTGGESKGALKFSASGDALCAVDSAGTVTALGKGTCIITATREADSTYGSATSNSITITVTDKTVAGSVATTPTTSTTTMSISAPVAGVTTAKVKIDPVYAGLKVSVLLGSKVKGKTTYKTLGSATVGSTGTVTYKSKVKLPKGGILRLKAGSEVLFTRTIS